MSKKPTSVTPQQVTEEYERGNAWKNAVGDNGMAEQNRINERFYNGDQWRGVNCGDNRPLVRHNVIKRIGDYKMAVISADPISVRFQAEGVPNTLELQESITAYRQQLRTGDGKAERLLSPEEEAQNAAGALADYFHVTARRLKLDILKQTALRNAYLTGTGILYTYWDDRIPTGLYADSAHRTPIRGDIAAEVLEVENVVMGDPAVADIQSQPYIIVSQRRPVEQLRRMAKTYGGDEADRIRGESRDKKGGYATLLTRFWKEWDEDGNACTVKAMQTCGTAVVRPVWDMGIRLYPLAVFRWNESRRQAYGESEIPYLIPNQIAINRTVSAGVWGVIMMGMPIMMVNGDVVTQPITNDPGQVIPVYGSGEEVKDAIRYVDPPAFSAQLNANVSALIQDTMTQAGVSSTLLGDVKPENAAAIIAVREASLMPLQVMKNRFYGFVEDVARIWAEFWLTMYGDRLLKIEQSDGVWYMPFAWEKYRDLLMSIQVEAGSGSLYDQNRTLQTLDNLLNHGVINAKQYLSRLPRDTVPKLDALLREIS